MTNAEGRVRTDTESMITPARRFPFMPAVPRIDAPTPEPRVTLRTISTWRPVAVVLLASLLGACSHGVPTPHPSPPAAVATAGSTAKPVATGKTATPSPAPYAAGVDHAKTARYEITLTYPALHPGEEPLAAALRAFGNKQKESFLDVFTEMETPHDLATYPWPLVVKFNEAARGNDYVSVLARGDAFTGGAHGNPILASFNFVPSTGKLVVLTDLLADPRRSLATLARHVRKRLLASRAGEDAPDVSPPLPPNIDPNWLRDGSAPKEENYDVFVFDGGPGGHASGVAVIFPQYQVAPYSQGPETVHVPAAVLRPLLKREYRALFVDPPRKGGHG